jgi:hypothetical protein
LARLFVNMCMFFLLGESDAITFEIKPVNYLKYHVRIAEKKKWYT